MKNSGRCPQWNFTKKYCTYTCHTLRVYSPPKVPLLPLSQTFLRIPKRHFVFVSSPKRQTQRVCNNRPNIVDLSYKVAFWFGAIARKGACTVISRSFARSADIVSNPVQLRFAHRGKFQKLFNDRGEIISNLGYSTSFPRNQKQQCKKSRTLAIKN